MLLRDILEIMNKFLTSINWGDATVTLLATFLGAWFAYKFSLRQQKQWDKERKSEEKEKQRAEQVLQLNYLQTYLYALIDDLYEHYQVLNCKHDLYANIIVNNYLISQADLENISIVFVDFSSKFRSNWDALYFTSNEPDFMYFLGLAETSWHNFVSCHAFEVQHFEKTINLFKEDVNIMADIGKKKLIVKQFIDTERDNNNAEIFRLKKAVANIYNMILVLDKYFKKHFPNDHLKKVVYNRVKNNFIKKCINTIPKRKFEYDKKINVNNKNGKKN